ncbi:hypothetical protein KAT92_05125, partial [Candidatus Babeliales bacterium]|nr:hypothetical protein [Candidatus Babeliales bacterium]
KGASGAAFIQGTVNNNLIRRFTYTKTTLALTTTNTHIFSVKSLLSFNEKINLGTARLVLMSLTSEDQGAVIELHLNAEITTPNWSKVKSGSSVMMFDTTGTVGINGSIILSTGVGQGDSKDYDLTPFNIQMHGIPDQDTISIIARSVKTTTDFVVTLVWEELV